MKITFHCGLGGPDYAWAPPDIDHGIGGSEECVIYLARELAALGHQVAVYNRCEEKAGTYDGVEWRNTLGIPDYAGVDLPGTSVLIAWRNWQIARTLRPHFDAVYLWCHDIPVGGHFSDEAPLYVDKFILLNDYHRRLYPVPDQQVFVCPIGVELSQFSEAGIPRIPGRVVYCSHPHRGLPQLRAFWPEIRARVPEATLQACWWQPEFFSDFPPDAAQGILPLRACGHRELAREILQSEVFGYPCTFGAEISPAATIKAQIGGAVPVVISQGGMGDTVKWGRVCTPDTFVDGVVEMLQNRKMQELIRAPMMAWGRDKYDWKKVAARWVEEFSAR